MNGSTDWISAQGDVDGRPIYIRARDPRQIEINAALKYLVVATFGYPIRDDGLPSDEDYDQIAHFEERMFDRSASDPELAFVETGSGTIRYFAYTSDPDQALSAIEGESPLEILDLDSAEDPEWEIYRSRVEQLYGG